MSLNLDSAFLTHWRWSWASAWRLVQPENHTATLHTESGRCCWCILCENLAKKWNRRVTSNEYLCMGTTVHLAVQVVLWDISRPVPQIWGSWLSFYQVMKIKSLCDHDLSECKEHAILWLEITRDNAPADSKQLSGHRSDHNVEILFLHMSRVLKHKRSDHKPDCLTSPVFFPAINVLFSLPRKITHGLVTKASFSQVRKGEDIGTFMRRGLKEVLMLERQQGT